MKEDHGLDRAAMIEAASRSLRQQMRGTLRPQSKAMEGEEPRSAENALRRIRSAEKLRSASSHEPEPRTTAPPSTTALDEDDVEEDVTGNSGLDDVRVPHDLVQLKRPASRKKDPSASAAAGLGAFSGTARMTDAFEQKKTRQPIPVESWGPRPPSRAGLPKEAADGFSTPCRGATTGSAGRPFEQGSRPSSKSHEPRKEGFCAASNSNCSNSKVTGGTWAAAREPREPREPRDLRRGRRSTKGPEATDLGIFGRGQPLAKSLSGVLDTQFRHSAPKATRPVLAEPEALEVSGCGLGDAWPASPQSCGGTPPVHRGHEEEEVEVEDYAHHPNFRRGGATPPQVIVTRSQPSRGLRRSVDQRAPRGERMPFPTSLDVDFLSLFAS